MYDEERSPKRRLYVASFSDDMPVSLRGGLIPQRMLYTAPEEAMRTRSVWYLESGTLLTLTVLLFAVSIGTSAYSFFRGHSSVAAPVAALDPSVLVEPEPFNYGLVYGTDVQKDMAPRLVELMNEGVSFIEVDVPESTLRLYEGGVATMTIPIKSMPDADSWWHIPAGEYEIDALTDREYSTFSNIYLPWSIHFGENFYINGTPYYPDGEAVPLRHTGGGVRLSDDDAERLFVHAAAGMPIIVRERPIEHDDFLYETKVDGVSAAHYLVADMQSSTVLAASDLSDRAPIASLVKLVTALVASEYIELDRNVPIRGGMSAAVITLVPRLEGGYSASMYSLLQLLLVESSNEAAEVIAAVLGRETFIGLMNEKAVDLGLTQSTFTDPSGLDDGNISSVGDLFRLVQHIYNHRGFILELTADQHLPTAYTNGQFGELINFNTMDDLNFIAGKVGETEAAGQTSISLHSVTVRGQERTVAIVLLGSSARRADTERLLSFVAERFGE